MDKLNFCITCKNACFKERYMHHDKPVDMYYCSKHKTFITDLTLCTSILGCKGEDYERK